MKKFIVPLALILGGVVLRAVEYWGEFDALITKLRTKGSAGSFMADVLISPLTFLVLVIVAIALIVKESRIKNDDQEQLPNIKPDKSDAEEIHRPPPIQIFNNPTISPTFNNSPHIDQRPTNYQTQQQNQRQTREELLPPSLKALPVRIRELFVTQTGEVTDEPESFGMINTKLPVAIAEIYREVDRCLANFVEVRAHVTFREDAVEGLQQSYRINDAHWFRSQVHHAKFEHGDSRKLVIAIIEDGAVIPYDGKFKQVEATYETDEKYFVLDSDRMKGRDFHVVVELIITGANIEPLSERIDYDLEADPPALTLLNSSGEKM